MVEVIVKVWLCYCCWIFVVFLVKFCVCYLLGKIIELRKIKILKFYDVFLI